jgi:hypothetical protein
MKLLSFFSIWIVFKYLAIPVCKTKRELLTIISLKYSPCAEVAAIMERKTDAENNFMVLALLSFIIIF